MGYTREEYVWRIKNASALQLLVITFELCIANLEDAVNAQDNERFCKAIRKSQDYLMQLMSSLDMKFEISGHLLNIYLYVNKILHESYFNSDLTNVNTSIDLLKSLLGSFEKIMETEDTKSTDEIYSSFEYKNGMMNERFLNEPSREYKA